MIKYLAELISNKSDYWYLGYKYAGLKTVLDDYNGGYLYYLQVDSTFSDGLEITYDPESCPSYQVKLYDISKMSKLVKSGTDISYLLYLAIGMADMLNKLDRNLQYPEIGSSPEEYSLDQITDLGYEYIIDYLVGNYYVSSYLSITPYNIDQSTNSLSFSLKLRPSWGNAKSVDLLHYRYCNELAHITKVKNVEELSQDFKEVTREVIDDILDRLVTLTSIIKYHGLPKIDYD